MKFVKTSAGTVYLLQPGFRNHNHRHSTGAGSSIIVVDRAVSRTVENRIIGASKKNTKNSRVLTTTVKLNPKLKYYVGYYSRFVSLLSSSPSSSSTSKSSMRSVAGALVTYVTASIVFWRNPHFLHKKKRVAFSATHISHRGGSGEGYENTLRNFKKAIENGTNMLELDVRLTRDGQVVVYHDPDLRRLTGSCLRIADLDYSQLPRLNVEVPIDTIPGESFSDPTWSEEDRRIPLLRQVFEQCPDVPINIDIKDENDRLIVEVSDLIQQFQRSHITVWGSFNNSVCNACYKKNPDVGLFFSAKKALLLCFLTLTGILPFIPLKETHYEVFLPSSIKRRRLQQVSSLSLTERLLFWFSSVFLVGKPLITHLRRRGIHVYFWVCNTEEEFAECLEIGANGIMTDFPSKLRVYLDKSRDL